ncbi:MAG TPA: efflux RND transporter permease subunit [Dissulfurispiraceae bacterium]|nr:efflux RND transporter permease subunit [Dissulfurispiraceae bacterium]
MLPPLIEGRQRYPVNVRYAREFRDDLQGIKRVIVPIASISTADDPLGQALPGSAQVPLSELADIKVVSGPTAIKSEEGLLAAYVYIDYTGDDIGGYIETASKRLASLNMPENYRLKWSGDFEYLLQSRNQLAVIIPLTLCIVFMLLYVNTRSMTKTFIVLLAVPFSLIGAFWLIWALGYNMSVAVIVGLIALAGIDAETGVIMLLYLDLACKKWRQEGRLLTRADLREAVMYGAVKRLRPKIMTVAVILAGLVPILFSSGIGSDVMKRIAAPMVGGIVTSAALELIAYPVIYMIWKGREFRD